MDSEEKSIQRARQDKDDASSRSGGHVAERFNSRIPVGRDKDELQRPEKSRLTCLSGGEQQLQCQAVSNVSSAGWRHARQSE